MSAHCGLVQQKKAEFKKHPFKKSRKYPSLLLKIFRGRLNIKFSLIETIRRRMKTQKFSMVCRRVWSCLRPAALR